MAALGNDAKGDLPVAYQPYTTAFEDPVVEEKKDLAKEDVVPVVSQARTDAYHYHVAKFSFWQSPNELGYLDDTPGGLLSRVTPQDLEEAEEFAKTLTLEEVRTVSAPNPKHQMTPVLISSGRRS